MELHKLSAIELGELVNKKEVSPVEVIEDTLSRIDEVNSQLHAFTYTKPEEAIDEAKKLEDRIMQGEEVGPLAGVPVALKDFLPAKKGWTASHGGVPSLITVDDADCEFWKAASSMGAIAVGKTNAPAFGFRATTDNAMYGPTSTPFNVEYNSGGSSGGSCAAVGSRLVPLASCGDAGGSTRCPSAWCGTFGFKPSAGVVPSVCRPDAWTATHPYCCDGPTGRTVDDVALMLSAMQRYDPRDPISAPLPDIDYRSAKGRSIRGMRIGITMNFNLFPQPDDEISSAILKTAEMLKDLGCRVDFVDFNFKHSRKEMEFAWLRGICIDSAIEIELDKQSGKQDLYLLEDELPTKFFEWNLAAFRSNMMDYRKFHEVRTDILDAHQDIFDNYDIIIAPVTGCMPVKNATNGSLTEGPTEISGEEVDPLIGFAYTYLENMIGTAAASIPIGLGVNNLPIGMQIIAPRYQDIRIFELAYAIEHTQPWANIYEKVLL